MAASEAGTEPISDDEILYRRIPVSAGWFNPQIDPRPSPMAFRPTRHDGATALSVYRAKHKPVERVADNPRGNRYYVAELRAGELQTNGITVVPDPLPEDPGHAVISDLPYENRKSPRSLEVQNLLAEKLCRAVHGPFPPP